MDNISDILLDWYARHGRDLPWRRTRDPYRIWLSEVILQQTRVAQGMDYYLRFTERFPDVGRWPPLRRTRCSSCGRDSAITAVRATCTLRRGRSRSGSEACFPGLTTRSARCGASATIPPRPSARPLTTLPRRARRQCFPGAGAAFRYRPSDRLHGRKAHVR